MPATAQLPTIHQTLPVAAVPSSSFVALLRSPPARTGFGPVALSCCTRSASPKCRGSAPAACAASTSLATRPGRLLRPGRRAAVLARSHCTAGPRSRCAPRGQRHDRVGGVAEVGLGFGRRVAWRQGSGVGQGGRSSASAASRGTPAPLRAACSRRRTWRARRTCAAVLLRPARRPSPCPARPDAAPRWRRSLAAGLPLSGWYANAPPLAVSAARRVASRAARRTASCRSFDVTSTGLAFGRGEGADRRWTWSWRRWRRPGS